MGEKSATDVEDLDFNKFALYKFAHDDCGFTGTWGPVLTSGQPSDGPQAPSDPALPNKLDADW